MSSVDHVFSKPKTAEDVATLLHRAWVILYAASYHVVSDSEAFELLMHKRIEVNAAASLVCRLGAIADKEQAVR